MAIALSGSLVITGSIFATQGITGSFSGSATSASYADTLGGLPSSSFAPAATFNTVSQSFATTSGSLSTRVTNLESTSSTVSSSFATTSGSIAGRVTLIEGQYATTGSNTFTGPQYVSQASNAISFTSTASLYTDGGLRVSKDSFVSGTAYFNNVVVYGTSSIQYITSSQVNFGTNIITVNTDTPAVRFGGLAVFDSGSTQLTGSMLWDSEKNHWIYSNPSGSTYNSAMLMNGPRNTGSLGTEQGTTSCALMMGQGGDHITSSMIYSYGNATCFYGQSFISSSGAACFAGSITGSSATFSGNLILNTGSTNGLILQNSAGGESPNVTFLTPVNKYNIDANAIGTLRFFTENTDGSGGVVRVSLDCAGAATFASTIAGTTIYGSTAVCSPVGKFTTCVDACAGYFSGVLQVRNTSSTPSIWSGQYGGAVSILGDNATSNRYIDLSIVDSTGALATQGMRIISSGNVGIGTICPSTALEVSSADLNNIFVTNPTTTGTTTGSGIGFKAYNGTSVAQAAGIILTSNTWSFGTYSANQLSIGSDGTGGLALRTACSAPIAFFTGCTTAGLSAERMRITSDGVVGIGTNAPVIQDGNLVVAGCVGTGQGATCTTAQINIWETTSGNKAGLWFGAVNCANVGVIGSRTATGNIAFQTYCAGWAERMRIVYNGSVGVGTASPYSNGLSVRGVSDDYSITVLQQNTDTAGYGFFAGNSGDFSIARLSGGVFSSAALKIQLNTNIACFASTVCAPSFISSGTICSTGNTCFGGMSIINNCLGIGTATPQHKLDIQNGNLGIYYNTNVGGGASGAQIYLGDSNFQGGVYACSAPGIGAVCSPSTGVAGDLAFYAYTGTAACRSERMRILGGGNVGIGATAPNSLLHICGAGTGAMLRIQNTSTVSGDQGPLIQFMSANQVGGQNFESGYIQSVWTSEGNGFAMRFATKAVDGSQIERMRITAGGTVQIGCSINSTSYNGNMCRYNFTALNTAQDLVGICANNGLIVIRDHTAGGTGAFLIDPNQGVICMASNIPATVSIAWSGSVWRWCLTSGGVPRCLGYGFYGA